MSPASYRTAPPRVGSYYPSALVTELQTEGGELRLVEAHRPGFVKGRAECAEEDQPFDCAVSAPGEPRVEPDCGVSVEPDVTPVDCPSSSCAARARANASLSFFWDSP